MGLVNELQESAERDDVLTVLRRAKRVSAKLRLQDISDWLDHEQNGYPNEVQVPSYRNIAVTICYNTNGYIPAGYGMLKRGIIPLEGFSDDLTLPVEQSIGTVATWISDLKTNEGALYIKVSPEMQSLIRSGVKSDLPEILRQVTFLARLNDSQIRNIPEQVKNKILDWACTLESKGVTGNEQSFSDQEKQVAQTVIFNINNSSIDQLNSSGNNLKEK